MKSLSRSLAVVAAVAIGIAWQWNTHSAPQQPAPVGTTQPQSDVSLIIALDPGRPTTISKLDDPHSIYYETREYSVKVSSSGRDSFSFAINGSTLNATIEPGAFFMGHLATSGDHQELFNKTLLVYRDRYRGGPYTGGTFPIDPVRNNPTSFASAYISIEKQDEFPSTTSFAMLVEAVDDITIVAYDSTGREKLIAIPTGKDLRIVVEGYNSNHTSRKRYFTHNGYTHYLRSVSYSQDYSNYIDVVPEYTDASSTHSDIVITYGPFKDSLIVRW